GVAGGPEKSVDAAHTQAVYGLPGVVLNLHFVPASQVDAAVALLDDVEFKMQFEVGELLLGDQIDAGHVVGQPASGRAPAVSPFVAAQLPAGEVFAIEKADRLTPLRRLLTRQVGRAPAYPGQRLAAGVLSRAAQLIALKLSFEDQVGGVLFVLHRHSEGKLAVPVVDLRDIAHRTKAPDKAAH